MYPMEVRQKVYPKVTSERLKNDRRENHDLLTR
jgi:hypothetical protein